MKPKLISLIFLSLIFAIANVHCDNAKSSSLPVDIQKQMVDFSKGGMKDSLFYSLVGYCKEQGKYFTKVAENKAYFDERGLFYRIDLADSNNNITVSFTFFKPANPLPENDPQRKNTLNEHLCICSAKVGYAKVSKQGKSFVCAAGVTGEESDNYSIDCEEFNSLNEIFRKYYDIGLKIKDKLQTIPVEILELTE